MWRVIFYIVLSSMHSAQSQTSTCFISAANSNTPNGIQIPNQNSVTLCSAACFAFMTNSTLCQNGFDFNNADSTCWFSTTPTTKNATNIDHYTCIKIPFVLPGTCNASVDNTNTNNGIAQPSANTLDNCITICLASDSCKYGFDWDPNAAVGSRCWISTTLVTNRATGVKHYYCLPAPNSTPLPPTIGKLVCKKYTDTNSPGGIKTQTTVSTVDACWDACIAVKGCPYGFDWVPSVSTCWLSTSSSLNSGSIGVEHYNCLQPTTLPSDGGSLCSWIQLNNTNTKGGAGQADYTTIQTCQAACIASTSCMVYGLDWDPAATPKCWFSTTNATQPATGVSHYSCQAGISVPTSPMVTMKTDLCQWTMNNDTSVPGGNLISNATSLDACKTICKANTLCLIFGFDWNPAGASGFQCYISTSLSKRPNVGVNHHFWNCSGCTYIMYKDTISPGGILNPAKTLEDCQTACLQNKSCWSFGFDWDANNPIGQYCWLSNSTALGTAPNVSHYLPTCSAVGNATTMPTLSGSNCAWNLQIDKHTLGGTLVPSATTLALCQDACISSGMCNTFGMDWDVSQPIGRQCYLSTAADVVASTNIAHYTFTCSVTSPPTARNGSCAWSTKANFQTIGGVKNNASTLAACQAECLKISTCSLNGLDFVPGAPAGSQCWISTNNELASTIGVDHYSYSCSYDSCRSNATCNSNTNSPGGILNADAKTQYECQLLCLKFRTQCLLYGFDWVDNGAPGTQCWLSTSSSRGPYSNVRHCSFANNTCDNPETSPQTCGWSIDYDKNSPGGTLNSASSLSACQSACLSSPTCKLYGFDWTSSQCWISNNPTLSSYTGVDHYKYTCLSPSGATTPNCWWDTMIDKNSPGGIVQPSILTEEACKAGCFAATTTCAKYGYDFNIKNTVGSQCWYSTSNSIGDLQDCTHSVYVCNGLSSIQTTPPKPSCNFVEVQNINSPGGTLNPTATTVDSCKVACAANVVTCAQYGFDWNVNDKTCYISTSTITSNSNGVSHYNYICSSSCNWIPLADNNSPGGVLQSKALTLGQCQSLCAQVLTTTCKYGLDWDSKAAQGSQCWFSTGTTTASFPGVTHYTCSGGSTSTVSTTTTTWKLTSKCGWNEYPGGMLSFPAGDPKPAFTTKQDCLYNCVGTFNCKAYAWRESIAAPMAKCVFYYVTTLPDTQITDTTYIHSIYFC